MKEFVRESEEWTEQVLGLGALSVVKDLLGSDHPLVRHYRRELAAVLNK